jgi:serine phosphatase RsbU (regulator of sigma subunit)
MLTTIRTVPDHPSNTQLMQCMEVWGGSAPADNGVSMAGLDAWVYSKPFESADAGGDVYYVSSCATGRITRLLVADVSGHGAAVRETAGVLRTLMRRYVNHLDQCHFVRSMNRQFTELSDVGCFATALVTTFFAPTNVVSICNAGHPAPLLYRARAKQWLLLERRTDGAPKFLNIPLGIEDIADYEQFAVQLEVGDLVLCYSDSLIEARDKDGELLGEAGLLDLARQLDVSDPTRIVPNLLSAVAAKTSGGVVDGDDVTVLLFRPNGAAPTVPASVRLAAPFRVIGGMIRALVGRGPMPLPDFSLANLGGFFIGRLNRLWS